MRLYSPHRGYTIVETTIASVLTLILGLTVILTIVQSLHQKRFERERAVALNRASEQMELIKRQLFINLKSTPYNYGSTVTETVHLNNPIVLHPQNATGLDVHNTPDDSTDDIPAQLFVRLSDYKTDQFIPDTYYTATTPSRANGDAVQVKVTVAWFTEGKNHSQSINSIIAP